MPPRKTTPLIDERQMTLPFSALRNRDFLSSHWLDHRLPLEPEWAEFRDQAREALDKLFALWRVERERVELYGDEAGLEEKFIQPVFEILGWHLKYQTSLKNRRPDYALFLTDDDLTAAIGAGRTSPDFWEHAAAVADAKAWHVNLDRPTRVGSAREYPPEQIEWYLNHSLRDFGILTNGRLWRLVPRELGPAKPRFQTYLELDLPALLDSLVPATGELGLEPVGAEFDDFLRFYLLFSPVGFSSLEERKPLLHRAVAGSSEYAVGVGEELRDRVFEALRLCVEGFIKHEPNKLDPADDLRACQEHSLIFLYRLLFIMYAEDRGLLPYRRNQTYTNNRSLARHRDDIAVRLDRVARGLKVTDFSTDETNLWQDLGDLFDIIDRGHARYGVHAYNGGLFDLEADSFLAEKVLPDWHLARVLDQLGRAPQPDRPALGLFRVDYRDLAIQQLGSVYEGLLELQPRHADVSMRVVRSTRANSRQELVIPASEEVPKNFEATALTYASGSVYLSTDKGERRRTGSYYTPDHIVDYIVQNTLGPQCARIFDDLQREIDAAEKELEGAPPEKRTALERALEELRGAFDDRVLELKVLDPAMGSGHFLIRACQYLAEEIAANPYTSDESADDLEGDESAITYWKRRVAENCLHGVDLNPMAVELAKLAIWLETVADDAPLTFLDHHFLCGDSVIGARIARLDSLPADDGLLSGAFRREVDAALPALIEPLDEIAALQSDTAEHVKDKEKIFKRRFLPAAKRFAAAADLWCADATGLASLTAKQYSQALGLLRRERRFASLMEEGWALEAFEGLSARNVTPFHWEVAYPQVFLAKPGARRAGFDVILGNPPYDVLSEKEIGANIDHLKKFIERDPALTCTRVGKNNLYKLFIARCVELLADGGYLGFIVPMPLLGDEQASGIRRMLLSSGEFCGIEAFPQKDNPARRVFPDAKLSTALFVFQRNATPPEHERMFSSRVHPAQFIQADSPTLSLTASSIDIYDPSNLTVVSCTQDDWDLATAIVNRPGIGRLGSYCKSYQGEVNETTQKDVLHEHDGEGRRLVLRGSNVCLYVLREASQGQYLFVDVNAFRNGKRPDSKAFHGLSARIGFQRSSPQNNFRRVIAAYIPPGELCFDTVSYVSEGDDNQVSSGFLLALLNSKLIDWYFRLGSTNSKVNEYQFNNLPCPKFRADRTPDDDAIENEIARLLESEISAIPEAISPLFTSTPFSPVIQQSLERLVQRIRDAESNRGNISRQERARLCPEAQLCQDAIDEIIYRMVGLSASDIAGLEERLARML